MRGGGRGRRVAGIALAAVLVAGCGGTGAGDEALSAREDPTYHLDEASEAESAEESAALPGEPGGPAPDGPVVDDPGVNPFVATVDDPLSTFATDVDTASYALARRAVTEGALPDPAGVRVEEFVNYFDQDYTPPAEGAFAIALDGAPTPFTTEPGATLVRVGLQAAAPQETAGGRSLTFVVDVSGSMGEENRLALVQRSLDLLVTQLDPDDTVGIVVYGDSARILLPPTPAADAEVLRAAIAELTPEGSTNVEAGLRLGYSLARESLRPGAVNRVVLATDGIANVGLTDADGLLGAIREDAQAGVQLVAVGVGVGGYRDELLERIADDGDGFYAYVDGFGEAQRLFVEQLPAALETVALDTKVQVAFDPATVARYRLLGYENRAVADSQFRDDSVDAGLVGAGDSVTALYEVVAVPDAPAGPLATVTLRWTDPGSREAAETSAVLSSQDLADDFAAAAPHLRLDATVAAYAEVLRESYWSTGDLDAVAREAEALAAALPTDPAVEEFAGLAGSAALLAR